MLNDRPLPARFYIVRDTLLDHEIESIVLEYITTKWTTLSNKVHNSIQKDLSWKDSNAVYIFGD